MELEQLQALEVIAVAETGYDQLDIAACRDLGIVVSNLRGWCDCSVSEHVFVFALALRRNLSEQVRVARDGTWHRSTREALLCTHPAHDLCGDTLGIIGFGNIAKRVATVAQALGMKVLVAERKGSVTVRSGRVGFPEVLHQSDIVSLQLLTHP